ncbi:MAG: hypothetical protein M1813_002969 [Trichoglossum hirsutum]|nr:MAG: hypothetical protein M1813_002969 [Trichoglossum hirsutum]
MAAPKLSSLAEIARYKLNAEAAHRSRDLRIMVGHANLLDSLIIRLQDQIEGYLDGGAAAAPAGKMPTELVVVGEIELGDEDSEVWDCDGWATCDDKRTDYEDESESSGEESTDSGEDEAEDDDEEDAFPVKSIVQVEQNPIRHASFIRFIAKAKGIIGTLGSSRQER